MPGGFTGKCYWTFKEELIWILHNFFQTIEEEGILTNSSCGASITLMPKPDKHITRKEYWPIFFMKWAKILNKMVSNWVYQYVKGTIHYNKMALCWECKWVQHWEINVVQDINNLRKKNHMIISIYAIKTFDKNATFIHDKRIKYSKQNQNNRNPPHHDQEPLHKSTSNILSYNEKLNASSLRLGQGKDVHSYCFYSIPYWKH